jgi:hypothetical protein
LSARWLLGWLILAWLPAAVAQPCGGAPVAVQVLGSGATATAAQAQSGYLIWIEGRARLLVDAGSAVALRFAESGATMADLDAILLTHLRADRSADLPILLQAARAQGRDRPLPVYGPAGGKSSPSTVAFIRALFDGSRGAYRYLGDLLNPLARTPFKLQPHDVGEETGRLVMRRPTVAIYQVFANARLRIVAAYATRETAPALIWRIEAAGKSIVLDTVADIASKSAAALTPGADWLGVGLGAAPQAPEEIAQLAAAGAARQLVLLPRTPLAPERAADALQRVKKHFGGPSGIASELACFVP